MPRKSPPPPPADAAAPLAPSAGSRSSSRRTAPAAHPTGSQRAEALDQSGLTHLIGYAATLASVELKKSFRRHLGPLKLKAVEFSILTLVDTNPEVNQKLLGEAIDVSPPNLAVTLDRMVEHGWVRRERSERDRRAQIVRLTPDGQALITRARRIATTMEQDALKVLSPAEQAMLRELLMRVARRPAD